MTAYIAGAVVVVLVVVGIAWSRLRAGHSDRRSMETYGHGLAALGDVTRRTSTASSVRVLPNETASRPHAGSEAPTASGVPTHQPPPDKTRADGREDDEAEVAPLGAEPAVPSQRPTASIRLPEDERRFDDAGTAPAEPGRALREPAERPPFGPRSYARPGDGMGRQSAGRKLVVAGTAAVAVAAIVAAAVLLTLHHGPHVAGGTTTTTRAGIRATTTTTTVATTTTIAPVKPVSTTATSATFTVPRAHYILRFAASTSPCWVGVEPGTGGGTYLWTDTVQVGSKGHYLASGPVAVQLGAPEYISVTLDGVPLQIPSGATYYELIFTAG